MKTMMDIKEELAEIVKVHGGRMFFDDFNAVCEEAGIFAKGNVTFVDVMTAARLGELPIVYKDGVYKSWSRK